MADIVSPDDRAATTPQELLDALKAEHGADGFQRQLDHRHSATLIARGPRLLVTFERVQDTLEGSETGMPVALDFAEDKNWSALHFTADDDSWFRSAAIYSFFDDLVDDGFFETFDRVAFYGAGMGGYAAAAFSVAAPGAQVLAVAPQATLDRDRAGWDDRFPRARRLDFTDRYGYAPEMLEAAGAAFVLFDPHERLDAVHASLFRSGNVTLLRCPHLGGRIARSLREMDLLHRVIEEAAAGTLTPQGFYRHLRRRRDHARYLRNLLFHLDDHQRPWLTALLCAHVLARRDAPAFRRRLDAARAALAQRGAVPHWLPRG